MSKSYTITDQQQWRWLVADGDPAYAHCKTLEKLGHRDIALTLPTIITGVPTPVDDIKRMQNTINALKVIDQLPRRQANKIVEDAEHQVRLALCMEALCTSAST